MWAILRVYYGDNLTARMVSHDAARQRPWPAMKIVVTIWSYCRLELKQLATPAKRGKVERTNKP